jgi:Flp pilus assembly pilin Flp
MSVFGTINWLDFGKGVLIAFGTVVLLGLYQILNEGRLPTTAELGTLALAGLAAALSYVLKNFFTNSKNKLAEKE